VWQLHPLPFAAARLPTASSQKTTRLASPSSPPAGGVRKELGIKTPFQAVEKPVVSKAEPWFKLKPEIFNQNPCIFKNKIDIFSTE